MLDTRMPPTSPRTRRSYNSAGPETRLHARPARGYAGRSQTQAAPARPAEEPVRRPLPSARSNRLGRSEMRLMGLATICTAVVCALLLLYLAAYARVTQLGIDQAQARTLLRQRQIRSELLQAERNALESPQRIDAAAAGMVPRGRTPINYISVAAQQAAEKLTEEKLTEEKLTERQQEAGGQGNSSGGTTEDSRTAASFGH